MFQDDRTNKKIALTITELHQLSRFTIKDYIEYIQFKTKNETPLRYFKIHLQK